MKLPEQVTRLGIVIAVIVASVLLLRFVILPASLLARPHEAATVSARWRSRCVTPAWPPARTATRRSTRSRPAATTAPSAARPATAPRQARRRREREALRCRATASSARSATSTIPRGPTAFRRSIRPRTTRASRASPATARTTRCRPRRRRNARRATAGSSAPRRSRATRCWRARLPHGHRAAQEEPRTALPTKPASASSAAGATPPARPNPDPPEGPVTSPRTAAPTCAGSATTPTSRRDGDEQARFPEGRHPLLPGRRRCSRCGPRRGQAKSRQGHGGLRAGRSTYGMGVDIDKCIGCGRCVEACKTENDVPVEPYFFRTWVERYTIMTNGEVTVECISIDARAAEQARPRNATSCARSSCPSSATTARTRPASRSARSAPPSQPRTASCWWTRSTASAAATASRPARTGRASSIRDHEHGRQVHVLLSPHHQGPAAGLRRGLPDRRADLRRPEEQGEPPGALPAHEQDQRAEAAPEHGAQGALRQPRRGGPMSVEIPDGSTSSSATSSAR